MERRSKLIPELVGQPQEKLVQMKNDGHPITQTREIPLVCFTGDTMWGEHFDRPDVLGSKILITECTFLEPEHRDRAGIGRHLHLDDIVQIARSIQSGNRDFDTSVQAIEFEYGSQTD